jgi:hypothetical protein
MLRLNNGIARTIKIKPSIRNDEKAINIIKKTLVKGVESLINLGSKRLRYVIY